MLFLAFRDGYRIGEVPVIWSESSPSSLLHVLRTSLQLLWGVIRLKMTGAKPQIP